MPYLFHPGLRPLLLPAVIAALLAAQNSQAQRFSEAGTPVSPAQREDKEFATPIKDCPTGQPANAKGRRSSATSNGSVIAQAGVDIFTARYSAKAAWSGWINAETLQADGSITAAAGWQGKSTADHLDALSDQQVLNERLILTWSDRLQRGVSFQWHELDRPQKASFGVDAEGWADKLGKHRFNFIRGDRRMEAAGQPPRPDLAHPFRQRGSRQGDIVNSQIWHTGHPVDNSPLPGYAAYALAQQKRQPMIYVGGNDGMLHGFSATDGSEKIAYIPRGVISGLARLSDLDYDTRHRYFVDGSAMSGDINSGSHASPQWRTVLAGMPGAGAKGYFVLDITHPQAFNEHGAGTLVLLDRTQTRNSDPGDCAISADLWQRTTCQEDKDLGHILAAPVRDDANPQRSTQITQLNNNRWALVTGNGYHSINQRPVLLIQYLDGNQELLRIVATGDIPTGTTPETTSNGLSAPRLVDINGDGRPDVVYAGDLQGNLWKFIIASDASSAWGMAFNGRPLYTAMGGSSPAASRALRQPITAPASVRANDRYSVTTEPSGSDERVTVGGMLVAFGTGRNITQQDTGNTAVQSIYSILDNTRYKLLADGRVQPCTGDSDSECKLPAGQRPAPVSGIGELAKRSVNPQTQGIVGRGTWRVDSTTDLDWTRHKGWYMDLPLSGERLLKPMSFYDGSNLLAIYSQIPARSSKRPGEAINRPADACNVSEESQFLTLMNIMDGKRPSVPLMDSNGDGVYDTADQEASRATVSGGAQTLLNKGHHAIGYDADGRRNVLARMPEQSLRPSWRQMK
ncbi:pilus assembly protein [Delftia sp. HK171]|uniref:pilus assembly protein n=1 Tax=Delftia sp. HK171 TaxID=1920191 RepID=UPI00114E61AB|nr:PilC/PilY family type IV pilus protein [Delftia sp. HK171]TQL71909.1 PilC-like protein with beta-propeller domain [Delftia sp. HK171]